MTLTESQRKRIVTIAIPVLQTAKGYRREPSLLNVTAAIENAITELAPQIRNQAFEEGRQAGLEEAAKLIECFPEGYGTGQAVRIRALKGSRVA